MLTFALVSFLAPSTAASKIVAASLFKNGFAVITREIDVPAGGRAIVEDIPSGAMGTVWITTTDGLKLTSVKNREIKSSSKTSVTTAETFLRANEGKDVTLTTDSNKVFTGKIVSVGDATVFLRTGDEVLALTLRSILSTSISGAKTEIPTSETKRVLQIDVAGGKSGRLYMIGLERGMTWSPSYSLDISDPKNLQFTSKAVLLNDLGALSNVEARLVTGFPNVAFSDVVDPLLASQSVDDYVRSIGVADAAMDARRNGFAGGGIGGQSAGLTINTGNVPAVFDQVNPPGVEEGDLFFYRLAHVTLDKGERAYYLLAGATIPYRDVYTWDSADTALNENEYGVFSSGQPRADVPDDVWHSLEFKNTVGQPLTTGPAVTWKNGELIGQDMLKYTSAGAKALVRITKALDIHVESNDEETDRTHVNQGLAAGGPYDVVTLKTTLKALNTKAEAVHLKITRPFTGELMSDGGAVVTKNAKGLRRLNPNGKLVWEREIGAGKTLTVTFTCRVKVRPGS